VPPNAPLDGVEKRIDPGKPIDKNLYDLPPVEAKAVKSTPGTLQQALDALEADHAFLLRGDVHQGCDRNLAQLQAGKRG
jgi:glutamine synthetase